jgi:glycosyltransferase involved in cell wall biosynthesis/GT2 family glycosyltransferase
MFSVLIPSYNHRTFLTECVLSALHSPLVSEVLLIDDGSSDRSPELFSVLERFSPRVHILPSSPGENRGAHARLNQLVEAAANDWVAPLNSDDLLVPGRFEAIQRIAMRREADLLFGDLVLIDGQGSRLGFRNALHHNEVPWPLSWDLTAMARGQEWLPMLLLQNIIATTTNMVFTKELHAELGGFRNLRYSHDWDFALRAAMQAQIQYAPAMLGLYRLHGSNTIKEAADRVFREVRHMLAVAVAESSLLRDNPVLMQTLAANHYVSPPDPAPLAVVLAEPLFRGLLQQEVAAARLPVLLASSAAEVPPEIPYLYQPDAAGAAALRLNDLRQVLLALAVRSYDALLLLRHSGEGVDEIGLANGLVLRRGAAGRWKSGAIRSIRLYPATSPEPTGPAIVVSSTPPKNFGVRVPLAAPLLDRDCRPIVFILPAFLAVGGVERLVLETMRHLGDRWRFVVVTTEPLRSEQGSTHAEALQLAPVYDLAELTCPESRLQALEILQDWYAPALVWIVNGAPWQVDHAANIRRIFDNVPIVDHQVYDHEAGWINRFGDPGVRAADRFIAINQKIRCVMQGRFGILPSQIDLVYHGSNMSRVQRREVSADMVAAHRRHFGLDPELPVFGMIGRLTAQKRPLDLVALAKRIGKRVQFIWVGLGELEAEVKAAMEALPNTTLISGQSDLRPVYEMLDGMVITSEFEGLPIVLIEALAMGVPALSTDVGAIKEVLDRYGSGMTFGPPGDIAELERAFKAFRKVLPELSQTAVRQAERVAEDFSSARMSQEYEASFRKAIEGVQENALKPVSEVTERVAVHALGERCDGA